MTAPTRRTFLASLAAAGAVAPLAAHAERLLPRRAKAPQSILVLGGTGFLGPHFVRAALANGHKVTLFNRGKTNPGLFKDLEQLHGDREKGDLEALKGKAFDAVVDTSGYVPAHVEATAKLFAENCKHYQFISTISVYGSFGDRPDSIDESTETSSVDDDKVQKVNTHQRGDAVLRTAEGALRGCGRSGDAGPGFDDSSRPHRRAGRHQRSFHVVARAHRSRAAKCCALATRTGMCSLSMCATSPIGCCTASSRM
jgi:2'-hydroxyisoflavone reductase